MMLNLKGKFNAKYLQLIKKILKKKFLKKTIKYKMKILIINGNIFFIIIYNKK